MNDKHSLLDCQLKKEDIETEIKNCFDIITKNLRKNDKLTHYILD